VSIALAALFSQCVRCSPSDGYILHRREVAPGCGAVRARRNSYRPLRCFLELYGAWNQPEEVEELRAELPA
jgi:hypothetical protein